MAAVGGMSQAEIEAYVPRHLVRALPPAQLGPAEQEFDSAVLFSDISGFTGIAERLVQQGTPGVNHLSHILNAFYGKLIEIVEQHRGELFTIVGDGVISVWPAREEDLAQSASRARACGEEIMRALDRHRPDRQTLLRVRTSMGVGRALLMRVGEPARWELVLAGEAVAQAFSADRAAAPGQFSMSPQAESLLAAGAVDPLPAPQRPAGAAEAGEDDQELLLSYLPESIRKRVPERASQWLAELRHITVLFVRLHGIDARAVDLGRVQHAVDLIQALNERYLGTFDKLVFDDKGTVATVVFGLPPSSHEQGPKRAVLAALELHSKLASDGQGCDIGVASGRVFWGPIGRVERRQYCLVGNVMNLASRLMQKAAGGVLCCPQTYAEVCAQIDCEELGPFRLKGLQHPMPAFAPRAARSTGRVARQSFGRTRERALLSGVVARAKRAEGGVFWIEAEAGLGKSSLVSGLETECAQAGVVTLEAASDSVEAGTPYHAFREPFRRLLGLDPSAVPEQTRARIEQRIAALPGAAGLAPLLGPVLQLDLADSAETARLTGQLRGDRTRELLVSLLREAARGGLVIVAEDVHWFDSASLALLHALVQRAPELPLVITTRPLPSPIDESLRALREAPRVTRLELNGLPRENIAHIITDRLGARRVDPSALELVCARSEGNPFFAESLALSLVRSGALEVSEGEVRLSAHAHTTTEDVPSSLDAVIGDRIDRVSAERDLLTLKAASVLGRSFDLAALAAIHPERPSSEELRQSLSALAQDGLIQAGERQDTFAFDHAVTQAVTYGRMPLDLRRGLHQQIAAYYTRLFAGDGAKNHAILAHHYQRGGVRPAAYQSLEQAAEQAMRAGAFREAVAFLERALWLDTDTSDEDTGDRALARDRARWHRRLAEALEAAGDKQRIGVHAREALLLLGHAAPDTPIRRGVAIARNSLTQAGFLLLGKPVLPPQMGAETAFEITRAEQALAAHCFFAADSLGMVQSVLCATNAAERSGSSAECSKCYSGMALLLGVLGQQRLARSYVQRAIATCDERTDFEVATRTHVLAALYLVGAGQFAACDDAVRTAQRLADSCNDHTSWSYAQAIKVWSYVYRGQQQPLAEAEDRLEECAKRTRNPHLEAWMMRIRASEKLRAGAYAEAAQRFAEALPALQKHGDESERLLLYGSWTRALWFSEQRGRAVEVLRITLELLAQMQQPTSHIVLEGLSDLLETLHAMKSDARHSRGTASLRNDTRRALAALRRYARSFPVGLPRYRHFAGLEQLARDRKRGALRLFGRGLASARRLGLPFEQRLLELDLEGQASNPSLHDLARRNAEHRT
ncbi:MAG TPA: adenylate/guanylate cyclase domain-containing protein [Polyangiaceae bacterium]|nr:adenylate/guanylate cyclase domain-containing protein [Polyangiaceae bacterium]